MDLKQIIRTVPNWPIPGVMFRDITSLLQHPTGFRYTCDLLTERYRQQAIDHIIAIDARGFFFGAVVAYQLGIPVIPVRKRGKLPYRTVEEDYALEYGFDTLAIHEDALQAGDRVIILDDLIATGGTAGAAARLAERLGATVVECAFVIELPDLGGREKLQGFPVFSLIQFDGD